ncbi:glycosyltransferase [Microcoleus sp. Pol12B4]|uniref:glycosyltransferase n=1 Tax=Microcoleus sp. Pol12B4 TaxID=3055395 RepID=UPI002FD6182B
MKKKVVFLIRDLNYGGAQRQLVTLVKALHQEDCFDVTVLHFYGGGSLLKDMIDRGIPTISLEKQERWDVLGFFGRLFGHLKRIQPDVLHGYLGESNIVTMFLKPLFPSTRIIWGIRGSNTPSDRYGWLGSILSQLERLLSSFTDLIVVNSHTGKADYVNQGFASDKMVVISNGIDTERFGPDSEAGAKVRSEWGISPNTILIGLVGRLNCMKDHPTFVNAAALLSKEREDVRFVCVGVGDENYAKKLYQLTDDLGIAEKIIWAGGRSDMPAVFNALNIACSSSSDGEGFPNVVGEAMACGVPCVVTDVGDSAWIVGDKGVVVPPKNPEALKTAINELIDKTNLDDYNPQEIRQHIVEQFSVRKLVLKTKAALLGESYV